LITEHASRLVCKPSGVAGRLASPSDARHATYKRTATQTWRFLRIHCIFALDAYSLVGKVLDSNSKAQSAHKVTTCTTHKRTHHKRPGGPGRKTGARGGHRWSNGEPKQLVQLRGCVGGKSLTCIPACGKELHVQRIVSFAHQRQQLTRPHARRTDRAPALTHSWVHAVNDCQ
jgi:hypothetical protein